jgi:hypothetical protein
MGDFIRDESYLPSQFMKMLMLPRCNCRIYCGSFDESRNELSMKVEHAHVSCRAVAQPCQISGLHLCSDLRAQSTFCRLSRLIRTTYIPALKVNGAHAEILKRVPKCWQCFFRRKAVSERVPHHWLPCLATFLGVQYNNPDSDWNELTPIANRESGDRW